MQGIQHDTLSRGQTMNGLLDSILDGTTGTTAPRIIGENHNIRDIKIQLPDFDGDLDRQIKSLETGWWDAKEYGMTREQAIARVKAAATPEARAVAIESIRQAAINRASYDLSNGRVNAAYAIKPAWTELGVVVDRLMNSAEAMELSGTAWPVEKLQLTYTFNGQTRQSNKWGIVRMDTGDCLGEVGPIYNPFQNKDGFTFLDSLRGEFGAHYESAGSLYGGKKVWIQMRLPEHTFSIDGDQNELFVTWMNVHDGSGCGLAFTTSTRAECANTVNLASRTVRKKLAIRHTGNLQEKVAIARQELGFAVKDFALFKDAAVELAKKPADIVSYTNSVLDAIFAETEAKIQDRLGNALESEIAEAAWERHQEKRREILAEIMERYEAGRCDRRQLPFPFVLPHPKMLPSYTASNAGSNDGPARCGSSGSEPKPGPRFIGGVPRRRQLCRPPVHSRTGTLPANSGGSLLHRWLRRRGAASGTNDHWLHADFRIAQARVHQLAGHHSPPLPDAPL
jgi:phage/plasmid-like protein (TIGR03299 family)